MGFDAHRFISGRPLVLGGITIPFPVGLEGHSDADVLCHAVIDAMLGAVADGDIGSHFPDTDPKYKDISSIKLLTEASHIISKHKYQVQNLDITLLLEKPRIQEHKEAICEKIAETLNIDLDRVSVKATTTEGLGFTGRGEGIAAQAVVLVEKVII